MGGNQDILPKVKGQNVIYQDNGLFATKKKEALIASNSHEKTRRNLKCMLPSETSQSEEATYNMIPNTRYSVKGKIME